MKTLEYEVNGNKYVLTFTRASVIWAEEQGFDIRGIDSKPMSALTELFYYAFRANHPNLTKEDTDAILFDELGGITQEEIKRLSDMYADVVNSLIAKTRKNSKVVVR